MRRCLVFPAGVSLLMLPRGAGKHLPKRRFGCGFVRVKATEALLDQLCQLVPSRLVAHGVELMKARMVSDDLGGIS